MNILITGASGMIGTALTQSLSSSGHNVFPMRRDVTNEGSNGEPFYWQPLEHIIQIDESIKLDAVIHLAGASIAAGRWNDRRKKIILESRETSTKILADSLAKLDHKPNVFISCSATGFYGNTGEESADESRAPGSDFLSMVCQKWENATQVASEAGIRTIHIRIGMVLNACGGALKAMLLPFKLGLGGRIGSGDQYVSWISIDEITRIIPFIIENETIDGPVNLVSPHPVTNRGFTETLGTVLKRLTIFPLPAFAARLILGEMADALLLTSSRVMPKKLQEAGYTFVHDELEKTLRVLLKG